LYCLSLFKVTAFDYLIGIFELFLVLTTSRFRTRASQIFFLHYLLIRLE